MQLFELFFGALAVIAVAQTAMLYHVVARDHRVEKMQRRLLAIQEQHLHIAGLLRNQEQPVDKQEYWKGYRTALANIARAKRAEASTSVFVREGEEMPKISEAVLSNG
jgi:hypothetical protein